MIYAMRVRWNRKWREDHVIVKSSNRIYVDTISVQSIHLVQLSGTKLNLLLRNSPEPNMLKLLPKMLSGISQNISVSLPRLTTFLTIILEYFNQQMLY